MTDARLASAVCLGAGDHAGDCSNQLLGFDGLREVGVHLSLLAFLQCINRGIRREHDKRHCGPIHAREAEQFRRFDTAHLGHVHVHDSDGILILFEHGQGLTSRAHACYAIPLASQDSRNHLLIYRVVISE